MTPDSPMLHRLQLPLVPLFATLASVLCAAAPPAPGETVEAPAFGLTFTFPELDDLSGGLVEKGQVQGEWRAKLDGDEVRVLFWALPQDQFRFVEPDGVADLIRDNMVGRDDAPVFGPFNYIDGDFGFVPYATMVRADVYDGTQVASQKWLLTGILADHGYALEVDLSDAATEQQVEAVEGFLRKGIAYDGPLRDREWTEDEIAARLERDLPESLEGERLSDPLRTDHYIVFGNSSGAKAFARKLEEYYDVIKKAFPFEEVEGQRLLPVFVFRTRDQYIDFVAKQTGWSTAQAAQTAGVASGDWYATTYNDPNDSTHIHELTHQIFGNRLLLRGGGSWFQEGVAVYIEMLEYKQELNKVKNVGKRVAKDGVEEAAAAGDFARFRSFFTMQSLLMSNSGQTQKGGSAAGQAYDQAGALIWFVMNDKRTRDSAQDWVRAIGSLARGDLPGIERTIRRFFGVNIEGFEEMYAEFWVKGR
jgi:hypothetical protein